MGHYYDCLHCGQEKGHTKDCPNNPDNWKPESKAPKTKEEYIDFWTQQWRVP